MSSERDGKKISIRFGGCCLKEGEVRIAERVDDFKADIRFWSRDLPMDMLVVGGDWAGEDREGVGLGFCKESIGGRILERRDDRRESPTYWRLVMNA